MLNLVALNYFDFDRFGLLLSTANAHLNIGVTKSPVSDVSLERKGSTDVKGS